MYGAAFLLLVFFTELPIEHWALGCIQQSIVVGIILATNRIICNNYFEGVSNGFLFMNKFRKVNLIQRNPANSSKVT